MRKIEILGHKIEIAFNMAVEIAYEEIAGKAFAIEDIQASTKSRMILCYGCMIANNEEVDITMDDLLKKASAHEVRMLVEAAMEEMVKWAAVPAVMEEEEQTEESGKKG